jgi:hypothetical protein
MSRNRIVLLLVLGVLLFAAACAVYALRLWQTTPPVDASVEELAALTDRYGLDRPPAVQFGLFLGLFIPALLLTGLTGMSRSRAEEPLHRPITRLVVLLLLFTYGLIAANYLVLAPAVARPGALGFLLTMSMAGLALLNFISLLVLWNGRRWGIYSLGSSSFVLLALNLLGGVPLLTTVFELSAVVVVYVLVRPVWIYME